MRNIISQITALWDICRRERKPTNTPSENITEPNAAVLSGRTWRPWVSFSFVYHSYINKFSLSFRNIYMH